MQVPFTCSDDALAGFPLSTFIHSPSTQDTKLIKSDTAVLDIYFKREELLRGYVPTKRTTSTNEISDGKCFGFFPGHHGTEYNSVSIVHN